MKWSRTFTGEFWICLTLMGATLSVFGQAPGVTIVEVPKFPTSPSASSQPSSTPSTSAPVPSSNSIPGTSPSFPPASTPAPTANPKKTGIRDIRGTNVEIITRDTNRPVQVYTLAGGEPKVNYASFLATFKGRQSGYDILFTDALKQQYRVTAGYPQAFSKIALPAVIHSDDAGVITLSQVRYEYEHPLGELNFSDYGNENKILTYLGPNLPGVRFDFDVEADFFANFAAKTDCLRITVESQGAESTWIAAERTKVRIRDAKAPVRVMVRPLCQSTRLPEPEKKEFDFTLKLKNIELSDAHD